MNLKRISAITLAALMLFTACIGAIADVITTTITDTNEAYYALSGEQVGLCMNVGSDETDRNFVWYSTYTTGSLEYALREGDTFPTEFTTLNSNVTPTGSTYLHRVYLSGLKPDSEYVYRIKNGTKVSQNYYFTTDSTVNFNFAFAGDPQIGASYNNTRDGTNWGKTVDFVKKNFPETSLFVSAGDQVNQGNDEGEYQSLLSPTNLPTFALAPSVGNHEDAYFNDEYPDTTYAIFGEHYNLPNRYINNKLYGKTTAGSNYWYTYNNVLFIHINTNNHSLAEHEATVKYAVESNPNATWKIIVQHFAFFGSHYFVGDAIAERRNTYGPMYQKYGIDLVLNGHEHDYVRSQMITFGDSGYTYTDVGNSVTDPAGIFYITGCSSSSSKFYELEEASKTPHIAVKDSHKQTITNCEVTANSFKLTTYDVTAETVIDTFEIKKTKDIAAAYDTNVALGKTYTKDSLYTSNDVVKYPDEGDVTMTDGKLAATDATYKDTAYMAFHVGTDEYKSQGYSQITVDLGAKYDLQRFVAQVGTKKLSNGITAPKQMSIYVSNDKSTWSKVGECTVTDSANDSCIPMSVNLDKSVNGRYVQYRFVANGNFVFVSEVEAYTAHTHTEGEMKEVRSATATCDGRKESRCTACGAVVNYEDIPAFNNDPNNRNRALAKSYTTSGWYIKDGETNEKYPDENGNTMTDGQLAADGDTYGSSVFAGFHKGSTFYTENGYFAISVDLQRTYALDKFVTEVATSSEVNVAAGVRAPSKVSVYLSEDNTNWTKAGEVDVTDNTTGRATVTLTLDNARTARYVQYRYVRNENSGFVFVSEVEAHEAMPSQNTVTKTNVAYTKTYTAKGLYPDAATASYPDENGKSLTDGINAPSTAIYKDTAFAGFNSQSTEYKASKYASITVDLGKAYNLDEFAVKMGTAALGSGIYAPTKVEVHISDNGTDWKQAATIIPTDLYETSVTTASVTLAPAVNARYVQYRITSNTSWIMISEVEAYEAAHTHTPADTWSSDKNNHWKECACGEDLNKASHTAGDWEVVTPATTEKAGEQVKKCTVCKYVLETKEIPKLDPEHTHSAVGGWASDKNNHWKECACGEDLNKASHTAGDWVVVTPATVEKAGEQVKKCTVCEYVLETKEIPKLEPEHTHAPADKWSTDKDNHWKECDCGEDLNKAAHTAGDWVVVTPATTEKAGEQVKKCTVCEYVVETKEIPKLEEETPKPEIMLGDVNDSKEIDSMDYVLVKRAYFGTFTFNDDQLKAADVNASGDIDSMDYVLIKRAYFGTFSFQ